MRCFVISVLYIVASLFGAMAENRAYEVEAFTKLDVSRGVKLIFTSGEPQSIIAESTNGDFERLIVEVKGDTLIVSRHIKGMTWRAGEAHHYTVTITAPKLDDIKAASGSYVTAKDLFEPGLSLTANSGAKLAARNVTSSKLYLSSTSGAKLIAENIEAETVKASVGYGAYFEAEGTCEYLKDKSTSGSTMDASQLQCAHFSGSVNSGGFIEGYARETVQSEAYSGGKIRLEGGAQSLQNKQYTGGDIKVE